MSATLTTASCKCVETTAMSSWSSAISLSGSMGPAPKGCGYGLVRKPCGNAQDGICMSTPALAAPPLCAISKPLQPARYERDMTDATTAEAKAGESHQFQAEVAELLRLMVHS